jgi:endo-1,4-beta-D-glucanase Y
MLHLWRELSFILLIVLLISCGLLEPISQTWPAFTEAPKVPGNTLQASLTPPLSIPLETRQPEIIPTITPNSIAPRTEPRLPFPQHIAYTPGSLKPNHYSQNELDQAVKDYYESWKRTYLRQACGEGRYIIYTGYATNGDEHTLTHSEAHGYGMVITALMAGYDPQAQVIFDGLYLYFRDHPSVNSPDLMAWNQIDGSDISHPCPDADPGNTGSATDGDMDIAYALLLADKQWGSAGEYNYHQEALKVIRAILEHEVNIGKSTMLLGDWSTPNEPKYYYGTRSSDFMPGHLRAFSQATANTNWMKILVVSYDMFQSIQNQYAPESGLFPDFIQDVNDNPHPAEPDFLEAETDGWYSYNACRNPWRLGVDYLLNGDSRAQNLLTRLNAWIFKSTKGDPSRIKAGYNLDGGSTSDHDYLDLAFVAPLGVGAMAGGSTSPADYLVWLNAIWELIVHSPVKEGGYYENTLTLFALVVMSGNWWAP